MTTINLHIERLVLEGLPLAAGEEPRVGEAVAAELTRLFGEDGTAERFSRNRTLPLVRAEAILRPASRADLLGDRIARAVYGAIGQ